MNPKLPPTRHMDALAPAEAGSVWIPPTPAEQPPLAMPPPPVAAKSSAPPRHNLRQAAIPLRKGHSPKTEAGEVVVLTPWYPGGLPKSGIQLSDEVRDFACFVSLTAQEEAVRHGIVARIKRWVNGIWSDASVYPYGSFACGMSLPTSAVDIMADGCGTLTALTQQLAGLGPDLKVCNFITSQSGQSALPAAFLQVEGPGGVTANVSFVSGQSQAQHAVQLCKQWIGEFPAAAHVAAVIRHILAQVKSADVRTGGLSSYCILLMAVHSCRRVVEPTDAGAVLIGFLQEFGQDLRYETEAVSPMSAAPIPKAHGQDQVAVVDPLDPSNNLASGCTRLQPIRAQFQYCLMALKRWEEAKGSAAGSQGRTTRGYKGRTPLSALISHQPLWARTDLLKQLRIMDQQDGAAQPAPAAIPLPVVAPAPAAQPLPVLRTLSAGDDDLPPPLDATPVQTHPAVPPDLQALPDAAPLPSPREQATSDGRPSPNTCVRA